MGSLLVGTSGGCGDGEPGRYGDCALDLTLTGAVAETIDINGCGWAAPRTMVFSQRESGAPLLEVSLDFAEYDETATPEPTGPIEVVVRVRRGGDEWVTEPCQAEWLTNARVEEAERTRSLITGTVSCSGPALPSDGGTGSAVEVGDFPFEGYLVIQDL
ncbi:MAG: hypothetical protein KC486_33795 [Myxococcales bacterium]|nr:hypothetical protein [Myxococcales bacterium]